MVTGGKKKTGGTFAKRMQKKVSAFAICSLAVIFFLLSFINCIAQSDSNINNPVLPGVADAGVIKFNGEYYIGGVFTKGSFYVSKDLVKWDGPVHVFSMDNKWTEGASADDSQIHANDIHYINGTFHMFWSVNYWGKDRNAIHVGHAISPNILGPFKEPVKDTWVDNRIDPELFIDDDGKLYLYMVKFTDGNTIWVRPMKDPSTFSGEPKYVFSSLPNTWETLDNRVEEGPWVIKYRGRYYMMYNANHTSPNWGNYALGVAEAGSPMDFNHGNKYPYPVVESNQIALEASAVDVLKYGGKPIGMFQYTFTQPGENWMNENFNDASWLTGKAGFGSTVIKNSTTRKIGTDWNTSKIWLRRPFNIDKSKTGNLMLRINHDGATKVFLNGQLVYEKADRAYTTWNLDQKARSLVKNGENILAVESTAGSRSKYLDVSIFDMKTEKGDDILFSPGQPNILHGPNGFDWWLIYMANKNSDRRGQYIDRVQFFDKRMFVDGVTGSNTPGFHPAPTAATFSDLFNEKDGWQNNWNVQAGNWSVIDKEFIQTTGNEAKTLIKSSPATHYLFQSGIKIVDTLSTYAGVIAWWKDDNNWLRIVLSTKKKNWSYIISEKGKQKTFSFPLPNDFRYNVYHTISVYKNGSTFTIKFDELPASGNPEIKTNFNEKGIPGLFSQGGKAAFDGVLYTIGWDEYDATISSWEPGAGGDKTDNYKVKNEGIVLTGKNTENVVFKGDLLESYEFTTQVTVKVKTGSAGIYPVYINKNNYVKALFDFKQQRLMISGQREGKVIEPYEVKLDENKEYHADMRYTDFFEKHFTLITPTFINGLTLNKTPHLRPDTLIEDIHKKMTLFYKRNENWYPLNDYKEEVSEHPGFVRISFPTVEAEAVKLVNKVADDQNFYVNKIRINELFRDSYNIRVVKLKDKIILLVNGKEVLKTKNEFPASRVGLITQNAGASFNGITLFHVPQ